MNYKSRIKHDIDTARRYTQRKPEKHRAEMALIARGFAEVSGVKRVLDAPCGVGRATLWLAQQGYEATGIDLGAGAVAIAAKAVAAENIAAKILQDDIEQMKFADRSFDATLCFRLIHHFPTPEIRERVIAELCRVSDRYVLISYLSPWSPTSVRRRLRRTLFGTHDRQHTNSLGEISSYFDQQGFDLVKNIPQTRFLKSLQLAVFKRRGV